MSNFYVWVSAFRVRTLPLALASILLGSFLAYDENLFNWQITFWASITTVCLQILSNLANDYGDSRHGVDVEGRIGPLRTIQSGKISYGQMKKAIIIFIILSFTSGIMLIYEGTYEMHWIYPVGFTVLGILAIMAAIKYTAGKNPYGYWGMGDFFVFIFFGIIGVIGTYFLHTHHLIPSVFLPAIALGAFSTGVLNLNNMRDLEHDTEVGKKTFAVIIGEKNAKTYHCCLILLGIICSLIYTLIYFESSFQWMFVLALVPMVSNVRIVISNKIPAHLDQELKKLAFATLFFSILFGIGISIV